MSASLFQISFISAVIVYLWLRTDALYEYFKFLNFKIFNEYSDFKKKTPVPLFFVDYLLIKYPNFLLKLLSCPVCLSVYISAILYFCGIESYGLFASIYFSWALFFALEKLNKK